LLPGFRPPAAILQQLLRREVKAAVCLRAHGYPNFPDPTVRNDQPVPGNLPSGIDIDSPQSQAAVKACGGSL
jgi:hypothetical protein